MRAALIVLAVAAFSVAGEPGKKTLLYLGLNEQGAEEWYRVKDGAVVIRVPGGNYLKRPYEGWEHTEEPKQVAVGSFFMDKFEVTNASFARFLNGQKMTDRLVGASVAGLERDGERWRASAGRENHPVTAATGFGAEAYTRWVGGRTPTAPEWEKAAGGPKGRLYPWGDQEPDATRANFARPKPRGTMPVGAHKAGASFYGCLDMAGNAYERVLMRTRDGREAPVMIKGGSWLSPHSLNLRVLDLCVQPMGVAEGSVGFRCAMRDPEPDRPVRTEKDTPKLELARDFKAGVAEAKRRRVPIFLSLLYDTCGQCDRTRAQLYRDPRFVAYCNEYLVVVFGHQAGHALESDHGKLEGGDCALYPGVTCDEHEIVFARGLEVVGGFRISPGNFVLHPDRCAKGAASKAILVPERELPKWGNAVEEYLAAFKRARAALATK